MVSDTEDCTFASVAAKKKGAEVKTQMKTKMLSLAKEVLKESRNRIAIKGG